MRRSSPSLSSSSDPRNSALARLFDGDRPDRDGELADHLERPWFERPQQVRCDDRPAGRMTLFA